MAKKKAKKACECEVETPVVEETEVAEEVVEAAPEVVEKVELVDEVAEETEVELTPAEKFIQKIVKRAEDRGLDLSYAVTKKGWVLYVENEEGQCNRVDTKIKVKVVDLKNNIFKLKLVSVLSFEHQKVLQQFANIIGREEPQTSEMKVKVDECVMKARDFAKLMEAMEADRIAMQEGVDAGLEALFETLELDVEKIEAVDKELLETYYKDMQQHQTLEQLLQSVAVDVLMNGEVAKLLNRLLPAD